MKLPIPFNLNAQLIALGYLFVQALKSILFHVMDRIQGGSFLHGHVGQQSLSDWRFFEYHGIYFRVIGELQRMQK